VDREKTTSGRAAPALLGMVLLFTLHGCAFGPKALESTHCRYNEAVKKVTEEQLLLNIVRMRYNESSERLDVSAIASQYELSGSAEARPFFIAPNPSNSNVIFRTFTAILPDVTVGGVNRPTVSLTPLDDPENIRGLFTPSSLDGLIFLSETSYPVATVYRLFVEYMNRLPNAVTASGPPRDLVPEFREFQRAAQLLQLLRDREDIRFVRSEKITEVGSPLSAEGVTSTALVEAAKNGYEYQRRPDNTWVLIRRDRRLELKINPLALASPEVAELCRLLHLRPGQLSYDVMVGASQDPFPTTQPPEEETALHLFPRSALQALFYLAHGVLVPPEHLKCRVVTAALEPDGQVFDWQEVTSGLFTVHFANQHGRPEHAYVAVKYRGYWFYLDDRDADSKISFSLMLAMTRINLLGVRKGSPALTLPVGR
jgi:hypothetical protein